MCLCHISVGYLLFIGRNGLNVIAWTVCVSLFFNSIQVVSQCCVVNARALILVQCFKQRHFHQNGQGFDLLCEIPRILHFTRKLIQQLLKQLTYLSKIVKKERKCILDIATVRILFRDNSESTIFELVKFVDLWEVE